MTRWQKILAAALVAILLAPGTFYAWRYTLCWHLGLFQASCFGR